MDSKIAIKKRDWKVKDAVVGQKVDERIGYRKICGRWK